MRTTIDIDESLLARTMAATQPRPTDVIRLLVDANPKSGKSRLRFDRYRDGMTVSEYREVIRSTLGSEEAAKCEADLKWDSDPNRRFIRLERAGKVISLSTPRSLKHPCSP